MFNSLKFKVILFGFIFTFFSSFGQSYFLGLFNSSIRDALSITHGQFGSIYASATLCSSLLLIWVGKKIDDVNIFKFALFVIILLAFACFFFSKVSSVFLLFIAIFLMRFSGQGMMSHTASTTISRYFTRTRGRALSISWFGLSSAEFIMPKKPLNLLKGILGGSDSEVTIEYNDSNAKFTFDNVVLVCRLIDGKYPNYEAVIPKENPNKLTIDRASFLNSVRRVSIFSSKTTHQIRLKMAGTELNISAEDLDFANKADERLSCDYQGDDMQIGFNSRFLSEMLNNLNSNEVLIEMSLPNRAGILTPVKSGSDDEKITMLVMPVMLNS